MSFINHLDDIREKEKRFNHIKPLTSLDLDFVKKYDTQITKNLDALLRHHVRFQYSNGEVSISRSASQTRYTWRVVIPGYSFFGLFPSPSKDAGYSLFVENGKLTYMSGPESNFRRITMPIDDATPDKVDRFFKDFMKEGINISRMGFE